MRDVRLMTDPHRIILLPEETNWIAVREFWKLSHKCATIRTLLGGDWRRPCRQQPSELTTI